MSEEDIQKFQADMEKLQNFLHIANDFAEHWRHSCKECLGVNSLDFVFHISSPVPFLPWSKDSTIINITHTSNDGLQTMVARAKLPLLLLSAKEKEELLQCEGISEELKARIKEVNAHEHE